MGVVSGTVGRLERSFLHVQLVLAAYVYELTQSNALVGLLTTVTEAGMFGPQLYVSSLIEHRARKLPSFIVMHAARTVAVACMCAGVWVSASHVAAGLLLFFVACVFHRVLHGGSALAFTDIIGKTVDPRRYGGFLAWRAVLGGILALVTGFLVVQPILDRLAFPVSYAVLVGAGVAFTGISGFVFYLAREDPMERVPKRRGLSGVIRGGLADLRADRNYRLLLTLRLLMRANGLTLAFYVPYGVERLGASGMAGVFIGVISASRLASSPLWGRVSGGRGNRACLIWSGAFYALSPIAALAATRVPDPAAWSVPWLGFTLSLPLGVYLLSLALFGLALQGNIIARNAFIVEIAPDDRRPSYIAFLNTVSLPMSILPVLAGWTIGGSTNGLDGLFIVVAVTGALTFVVASRLTEVREDA
ncbi:hypothetical protein HN371_21310 [Candidatus Poribacteria bacterium]|nr:hypothetical protein [Candidatus Poribacteria bacterium]MBT5711548.1 hypothetical protein [Candidatus Poribacteria bacterium]MBT7096108.1 hypothetical protein [Candidatus Poribacteria bacterium]MBT7808828.1 hypothetical protein [Candidatus Poribacteria bacterium]